MKNKELLKETFSTLMYSWGGDTPPEAIWTYNRMIQFLNAEFNMSLKLIDNEDDYQEIYDENIKTIDPSDNEAE